VLVVHAHHVLFALRQLFDRLDQGLTHALVAQQGLRVGLGIGGQITVEEVVLVVALGRQVFQVHQLGAAHPRQRLLVVGQGHAQFIGNFRLLGRARQALLQPLDRLLDVFLELARAARHPVAVAQLVEHGAADALAGKGFELHALRRLETRQGLGQANHADLDEVVQLHTGRQFGYQVVRQTVNQGAVFAQLGVPVKRTFGGIHLELRWSDRRGSGNAGGRGRHGLGGRCRRVSGRCRAA